MLLGPPRSNSLIHGKISNSAFLLMGASSKLLTCLRFPFLLHDLLGLSWNSKKEKAREEERMNLYIIRGAADILSELDRTYVSHYDYENSS